jgi:hypothetical protein
MNTLGSFLVVVVVMLLGVFLMIAAYSRKPVLLRIATLGTLRINPDSPGRKQRAIMFSIGVALTLISLGLIIIEKLGALGLLGY